MTSSATLAAAYSVDRLAPPDISALCHHLSLPLPTPDVPLATVVQDAGLTPADIYNRLSRTTDIRLMIAAAAMRGVTRLPADPRLDPKPHARAPVKVPRTEAEASRNPAPLPPRPAPGTRVLVSVVPNPKKKGSESWTRFQLYEVGLTEAQLVERGLRTADIRWDTERSFVTWSA